MKKKTEKEYSEYLMIIIKKWQPRLHLDHYTIRQQKDAETKYLSCLYNYPYHDGAIQWSEKSFEDWQKGDPEHERRVVHELCHLITDPFYTRAVERYITKDALEDERERLTDFIAVIAFKQFGLWK